MTKLVKNGEPTIKSVIVPPTWVSAVAIYIACLENPKAGEKAKQGAREELMCLAKFVDGAE